MRRLALTVRTDAFTNWKEQLRRMLILMFSMLTMSAISTLTMHSQGFDGNIFQRTEWTGSLMFIFTLFMLLSVSTTFLVSLKTKQQRTTYFMTPASNLEKFISCWLFATVGAFVVFSAALVVGDLLRIILDMIVTQNYYGSLSVAFFSELFKSGSNSMLVLSDTLNNSPLELAMFVMFVELAVLIHSVFLLGGTIFRRQAWIMTMCFIILAIYIFFAADMPVFILDVLRPLVTDGDNGPVLAVWGFNVIQALLIALIYRISYMVFCRIQVISNKWINL